MDHSKDDISTSVASVGESLDCIVCDLGQLSLCVKIEDKLCETNEERTMFSLPTDEVSIFIFKEVDLVIVLISYHHFLVLISREKILSLISIMVTRPGVPHF